MDVPFPAVLPALDNLDGEAIRRIVLAAADVALIVDREGVVRDVGFRDPELPAELEDPDRWLGRGLHGTVTVESRPKLDALLSAAAATGTAGAPIRWRHLNHPGRGTAPDVPISYSAVPAGTDGTVVVLGRDLRGMAALQQRLVDAQQAIERDHDALRGAEARFRALFEDGPDGLVLIDGRTLRVTGLNPAARTLLGIDGHGLPSYPFPELFDDAARETVAALAGDAMRGETFRAPGTGDGATGATVPASSRGGALRVAITVLAAEAPPVLLARLRPGEREPGASAGEAPGAEAPPLPALVEAMPDAVALCDASGDAVVVNAAFRAMAAVPPERALRGEALSGWIGDEPVDLLVLLANLRRHGSVRLFRTSLRPENGGRREVEIAAMRVPGGPERFALFLRDISRRLVEPEPAGDGDRMKALIGRVSLKELVRDSTDAIERLCIESALEMTGNNRASAAEMLGLSRQSLYVKLRRFRLGGADDADDADPAGRGDDGEAAP